VEKQRLTIKNQDNQGYMRVTPSLDHAHFVVSVGGYGAGLPKRTYFSAADGQQVAPPKPAGDERTAFLRIRFADYDTGVVELEDTVRGITHVIGRQAASFGHAAVHPQGKIAAVAGSERDQLMKMTLWDLDKRRPILSVPEADARNALALRFSPDGKHVSWVTNAGWTRIVPTDWLLERKDLLAPNPNEVAAP
jgi:hypothetical protein